MKIVNIGLFIIIGSVWLYSTFLLVTPPRPEALAFLFMLLVMLGLLLPLMFWLRIIIGKGKYKWLDWPFRDDA